MTPDDAMYQKAVDLVIRTQNASVSMLQRHLRIGFSQAADYLSEMQALGIVSAHDSLGRREVLVRDKPA
jgi:S-DNA-T family DNA segregation ATPase FtsK/SpoIIIE